MERQSDEDHDRRQMPTRHRPKFRLQFSLLAMMLLTCMAACLFAAYRFVNRPMLIHHPEQFDGRKDVVEVVDCSALDLEGCFTIEAYVRVPVRQSSRFFTSCIVAKGKEAQTRITTIIWES